MKPILSSSEAKLLYALLDAAHDDGLMRDVTLEKRWLVAETAPISYPPKHRAVLYWLAEDLDASGAWTNSWMRERWLSVKERVENEPMELSPSQAPFVPRPQT